MILLFTVITFMSHEGADYQLNKRTGSWRVVERKLDVLFLFLFVSFLLSFFFSLSFSSFLFLSERIMYQELCNIFPRYLAS